MLIARCIAALGLLVVLGACETSSGTCNVVNPPNPASFLLSCASANLTQVGLSGPCATGDASPAHYVSGTSVDIYSAGAGVCHVELTFETGFTYSTDVTFTSVMAGDPKCPSPIVSPTQSTFVVNNPSNTCVNDAGLHTGADAAIDQGDEG
jgi:hypothetical protein